MLAAGGRGRRSGSAEPKQFRLLQSRPLFMWSLEVFLAAGCAPVVVVVAEEDSERAHSIVPGIEEVVIVHGGATRRASIANGLEHVTSETVVVHDAARPFITKEAIEAVVAALVAHDGAVIAVPVDETLKRVEDKLVLATVDRSKLWRAQTPQAFRTDVLRSAHRRALQEGFEPTDDAQLLEAYGGSVAIVEGARDNLKVTYAEDFLIAESIARARS